MMDKQEPYRSDYAVTRHALVLATMLERVAMQIRTGRPPEELAEEVRDLAALMGRET